MIYVKNISSVALFATLILGSIPFSYAMQKEDEIKDTHLQKLSFRDLTVEPAPNQGEVLLSVKEAEKDDFRRLTSAEAQHTAEELIQAYNRLPRDEKITKFPFIKIVKRNDGAVVFKEQVDDINPLFRYLTTEKINETLQFMLGTYTNAFMEEEESKKQEALKKRIETERLEAEQREAQRIETERLEVEKAAILEFEKEKARLQTALLEQAAEERKQRQEQEIAALKAQLATQEATAAQEKLKREQEILKLEQQAAAQAEALKKQQQEATAKAERERTHQVQTALANTVGKPLAKEITGGRSDERIKRNVIDTPVKDVKKEVKKHKKKIKKITGINI